MKERDLSIILASLFLIGCGTAGKVAGYGAAGTAGVMGAGMAIEWARDTLLSAIEGVDKNQTFMNTIPETSFELSRAKKVAVLFVTPGSSKIPMPWGGGESVLQDSLSGFIMQMGYDVVPSDAFDTTTTAMATSNEIKQDSTSIIETAKKLGVELIVSGSLVSSMDHDMNIGIFSGRSKSHIKSIINAASIRITSCKENRIILSGTVTYKKGKPAADVAKDLSIILQRARGT